MQKAFPGIYGGQRNDGDTSDNADDNGRNGVMRTSVREYNRQYRDKRLYVDGYQNAEIVPTCNEHKRCEVCPVHSHVELCAWHFFPEGVQEIYTCPTCGKSYGVLKTCEEVFETFGELGI